MFKSNMNIYTSAGFTSCFASGLQVGILFTLSIFSGFAVNVTAMLLFNKFEVNMLIF